MDVTSSGVQLLTPQVDEHIYRAGNWDQDPVYKDRIHPLEGSYTLTGVKAGRNIPSMNADTNLVLSKAKLKFQVDPKPSYVTINLPLPREIHFLRFMKGTNLYRGIQGSGLALCTVFVYEVCKELQLGDSGWKPYFYPNSMLPTFTFGQSRYANHSWPCEAGIQKVMCLLLACPLEPLYDDTPPLDLRHVWCTTYSEMGWSEWQSNGEGSRPQTATQWAQLDKRRL
jgi:hypothetical protein